MKKAPITIYRIQQVGGDRGPYTSCSGNWQQNPSRHLRDLPSPFSDHGGEWQQWIESHYNYDERFFHCGFTSIEELKAWFTEDEISVLKHHGFEIISFQVQIWFKLGMQTMFIHPHHEIIATKPTPENVVEWIEERMSA